MLKIFRQSFLMSAFTTAGVISTATSAGKAFLVTGANRGIGLAICNEILHHTSFSEEHDIVYLGSRSFARGLQAIEMNIPEEKRHLIKAVQLDVTDDLSIEHCRETIESDIESSEGGLEFYGLVNNAGGFFGKDIKACLDINIFGMKRVTEAFLPIMKKGARIVNIGSAAGPNYVARQTEADQAFLTNKNITWDQCEEYMNACLRNGANEENEWSASYGLSKAMVNCYTMILARENKDQIINCCTPGYILTDLTRPHADKAGKTPEEMGMKSTNAGAKAPVHCLFGDVGHGWYYGSDCKRSPIDRYRSPGEPEYTEEKQVLNQITNV